MLKNKLLSTLILTVLSAPGFALAEDIPAVQVSPITSNVGFTSDYTFRGISQNFRNPALQGGFDYTHSSGVYLGTWASNVSSNQYTNTTMEWDMYGGYNGKVNDDFSYNVGLITVYYPDGVTATTGKSNKWDTTEVQFGGTFKGINVAYHYSLTDWFGISSASLGGFEPLMWNANGTAGATTADGANVSSKGSGYLEANYSYEIPDMFTLSVHAGHQTIANFGQLSYTDYKIGANKSIAGLNVGLAYTTTNATDNNLYDVVGITGQKKDLRSGILALSVNRSF